jgi:hypothetical protein
MLAAWVADIPHTKVFVLYSYAFFFFSSVVAQALPTLFDGDISGVGGGNEAGLRQRVLQGEQLVLQKQGLSTNQCRAVYRQDTSRYQIYSPQSRFGHIPPPPIDRLLIFVFSICLL